MSDKSLRNSTVFSTLGLSVTFAIALMTLAVLDVPAKVGWATLFLIPMVCFAVLLHRSQAGAVVRQRPVTALLLLTVPAMFFIPRITWEGTAVVGLAGICLILGVAVGMLIDRSYASEHHEHQRGRFLLDPTPPSNITDD